jgi:hypothetical protein
MGFVTVLVNSAVQSARLQPAGLNFHVRDLFPPAFWSKLPIAARVQIGEKLAQSEGKIFTSNSLTKSSSSFILLERIYQGAIYA